MDLTNLATTKDFLGYLEWADSLVWRTVLSAAAAKTDAVLKEKLYHVHVTQHAFLQVWLQVTRTLPANDSFDMAALGRWAQAFYAEANAESAWLDEAALARSAPPSLMEKAAAGFGPATITPTIGDTIFQVVLHTTHHRGQIRQRLRELGCPAPQLEYFIWVWHGRPKPDWPINTTSTAAND